jgi:hypothetical protein
LNADIPHSPEIRLDHPYRTKRQPGRHPKPVRSFTDTIRRPGHPNFSTCHSALYRKQFISRLGQDDQIQDGLTKGEASAIISDAKASGATNNNGGNASSGSRASGAAPE